MKFTFNALMLFAAASFGIAVVQRRYRSAGAPHSVVQLRDAIRKADWLLIA